MVMALNTRTAAIILGIVFIIVGLLGYVPNPIVGPTGLFLANGPHNLVHIVSGIFLLIGAYTALGPANALRILGVVYALVAVLGFVLPMPDGLMFGFMAMNMADNWLHVVLAIVLLAAGFQLPAATRAALT
jgi:hypothetical protein